ncbi:Nucleoid occlusion protein [subsurface metagenome]
MVKGKKKEIYKRIKLDQIDRPEDIVRMDINPDELQELVLSIQERGLMQPIEVTPRGDRFLIVFGDRRYLAHKMLKKEDIMCRIEDMEDDQVVLDRAMENVQRVNLTSFEEGHIYKGLMEKAGLSLDDISRRVGKSPGVVQRRMDILRMPESFQKALHAGLIVLSVAEELWSCPDNAKREYFLDLAVEHGITRDVARQWVADYKKERRTGEGAGEGGRGATSPYEDVPIYRGCDICKHPVEYRDVKELRICPGCFGSIVAVIQKDS